MGTTPPGGVTESQSVKRVLMIAYHYPPCFGSSGVHRTLKFSRHLPGSGWEPIVLTAHPRAYPEASDGQVQDIPEGTRVKRAFALDTARHLSVGGRYPRRLALPDRWASWWLGAVPAGLGLIRRYRPAVLWSTYPIATAHCIALTLHRLTRLPWIADFRDPMVEERHPAHSVTRDAYLRIEETTVARATRLTVTAESTRTMYLARYPALSPQGCVVIPNGYDEDDFTGLDALAPARPIGSRPVTLIHAGIIYPEARDPSVVFRALSTLKASGRLTASMLRIHLRDPGFEDRYCSLLSELKLDDIVDMLPALPYRDALRECAAADGLLLLQGPSCNHQIPAKTYEYLRLRRPILALTSHEGDTARLLRDTGGATIVDLMDEEALREAIPKFLTSLREGTHPRPSSDKVGSYERRHQGRALAACFDDVGRGPFQ